MTSATGYHYPDNETIIVSFPGATAWPKTSKAWLILFSNAAHTEDLWLPKSVCRVLGTHKGVYAEVPLWLAAEKNLRPAVMAADEWFILRSRMADKWPDSPFLDDSVDLVAGEVVASDLEADPYKVYLPAAGPNLQQLPKQKNGLAKAVAHGLNYSVGTKETLPPSWAQVPVAHYDEAAPGSDHTAYMVAPNGKAVKIVNLSLDVKALHEPPKKLPKLAKAVGASMKAVENYAVQASHAEAAMASLSASLGIGSLVDKDIKADFDLDLAMAKFDDVDDWVQDV